MTFYLQSNKEGRVFIDKRMHVCNVKIREIEAPTWRDARETVHEFEFEKRDGYGWFIC